MRIFFVFTSVNWNRNPNTVSFFAPIAYWDESYYFSLSSFSISSIDGRLCL